MKLRSVISILLIACLVMFAAACGGGGGGGSDDPAGGGGNGGGTETIPNYLCFTSSDYSSFKLKAEGVDSVPSLEWSKDGSTWTALGSSPVALEPGDKVYLRGDNAQFPYNEVEYVHFVITGPIAASGNIMSLIDPTCASVTIPDDCCFNFLFKDCTSLTSAPELPATTLSIGCYAGMFEGCTNLTVAPELPATTLAESCYAYMFNGCTNLTVAPELPAETLKAWCYEGMFMGCSNLTAAPELPAITLQNGCYSNMFYNCSNLSSIKVHFTDFSTYLSTSGWVWGVANKGTFICPSALPHVADEDFGSNKIPKEWDVNTF